MVTISCIPRGPITKIEVQISTLLRALPRLFVTVVWSRSLFDQLLRPQDYLELIPELHKLRLPTNTHAMKRREYHMHTACALKSRILLLAKRYHFLGQLADPCLFSEQPWWKYQDKSFTGCQCVRCTQCLRRTFFRGSDASFVLSVVVLLACCMYVPRDCSRILHRTFFNHAPLRLSFKLVFQPTIRRSHVLQCLPLSNS